jgi:hypothetical protein
VERKCLLIFKFEFVRHDSRHVFHGDRVYFYILVMIIYEIFRELIHCGVKYRIDVKKYDLKGRDTRVKPEVCLGFNAP